jgi:hypothetical protein
MRLKLVRHLWGVDLGRGLRPYLAGWRDVGYQAIEVSLRVMPNDDARAELLDVVRGGDWGWVPQVFSNDFVAGGSVGEHLASLRAQVEECLDHRPVFINAHSGYDAWSTNQAQDYFGAALELEKAVGVTIAHETHRSRCFATPWQTRDMLRLYPGLRLTCDLSHWVCVCERLLPDFDDVIDLAAQHCQHVHARVGYAGGPQVPDPAAPEYAVHLAAHEAWWERIWRAQHARGLAESTLTPEFGPPPYLQTLPHTQAPVVDLTRVCDWMARRQAERYARHSRGVGAGASAQGDPQGVG